MPSSVSYPDALAVTFRPHGIRDRTVNDTVVLACNKRDPGSGCGARHGENRHAGLFGGSPGCVATHPSDLAVALAALDAEIAVSSASGERELALSALYPLPGETTAPDSSLRPGEMITAIRILGAERFAPYSTYLKIRDRASFEFAVVS